METRANTRAAGAGATGRHHGGAEAVQFGLGLDDAGKMGKLQYQSSDDFWLKT